MTNDELLDRVTKLELAAQKSLIFFKDVIPQIGGIVIQDYQNMNELGCLLEELKTCPPQQQ